MTALKSLTADDPAALQADVTEDTATVADLIASLRDLDLAAEDEERLTAIEAAFADYTAAIGAFVDAAVQGPGRPAREGRGHPDRQRRDGRGAGRGCG